MHLDYTKVIILILWWRNFQLEYWRTFQLVSTQRGKELIESVTNPEVKKGMKEALSQLQSSLEKVQRQEKGLKKGFF